MFQKTIRRRPTVADQHLSAISDPTLRQIYARRGIDDAAQLERSTQALLRADPLSGIDKAVQLLVQALQQQQHVVIVGDFDADGATSTALLCKALQAFGLQQVSYLVPNRFEDGYGLTAPLAQRAAALGGQLLITVDNGISAFEGVDCAKALGLQVLVTDHHLPAAQLPAADAIVNPNLADCQFASKKLAGVGVVFYLMVALRAHLAQLGHSNLPNLAQYLDLVALGTVADVVGLDSNNRILVHQGLQRIRAGKACAGIQALLEVSAREAARLTAADLGFAIGPRLNAAGRLDDMSLGIACLLSNDIHYARRLASELDGLNQERKSIEQSMQSEALRMVDKLTLGDNLPLAMVMYQADWHAGVVGLVASRIKEKTHRPSIAFAQEDERYLKGSARSIPGVHMRDLLDVVNKRAPGVIVKFGGHAMAAGLSIELQGLQLFQQTLNQCLAEIVDEQSLQGVVWSDGELSAAQLDLSFAQLLEQAGPWGQEFAEPVFDGVFEIKDQRLLADKHLKLLLQLPNSDLLLDAIAFNVDVRAWPNASAREVQLAYKLAVNHFRGRQSLQLMVEHLQALT